MIFSKFFFFLLNFYSKLWAINYFRLTPSLVAVVFWYAFVMEHTGSGPQWNASVKVNADMCKWNGWFNLLYIQNILPFEKMVSISLIRTFNICFRNDKLKNNFNFQVCNPYSSIGTRHAIVFACTSNRVTFGIETDDWRSCCTLSPSNICNL